MSTGKVSVIIPAFNRAKYIRQTVNSVLNQSYSNIETIVIDDGCTDKTHDILKDYEQKILLLEHPDRLNLGQSASINLGLRHASGEFIAILDSDDYWEPDKLNKQVNFLQTNQDVGLVYCNGTAVDSNGGHLYDIYPPDHCEENKPENVLLDCYIHLPSNSLIRKSVIDEAGQFNEEMRAAQDHDMLIRVSELADLAYIDEPVYHYRRHQESISKSNKGASIRWKNGFIILERARKRFPYPEFIIRKRKAVLHFRLFQCALENKSFLHAIIELVLSGFYDPVRACSTMLGKEKVRSQH